MNRTLIGASACVCMSLASCQFVFEIRDYVVVEETTATGGGGAGGGAGGQGGSDLACTPLTLRPCYSGPEGTEAVGLCEAGAEMCNSDGTGWGACAGEKLPGVELCAEATDENCDGYDCGIWSLAAGDESVQEVQDVAVDKEGNVVVVGRFAGTIDLGDGPMASEGGTLDYGADFFVAKFDMNGKPLWSKRYGDADSQQRIRVALDQVGNVLLAGAFRGAMDIGIKKLFANPSSIGAFAMKLTPDGAVAWGEAWGNASVQGVDVAVDQKGDVAISAFFYGQATFVNTLEPSGIGPIFLVKLAGSSGWPLWDVQFSTGNDGSVAPALASDADGNFYLGGPAGGLAEIPGTSCNSGAFIAKFDTDGENGWTACHATATAYVPSSIAVDSDANVFISTEAGTALLKLDSTGKVAWEKPFMPSGSENPGLQLAVDANGDVVVVLAADGSFDMGGGALKGGGLEDLFIARYSSKGEHQWSKVFGDAASQRDPHVALGPDGTIAIACNLNGKLDFGNGAVLSKGSDIAVARIGR